MAQSEEKLHETTEAAQTDRHASPTRIGISKHITDHLANERTFLAWIRTGLSVMAFGFVVERFGLLLRELGLKISNEPPIPGHYSSFFGFVLTLLGVLLMVFALFNFLHYRRSIDAEHFHPRSRYAIALTIVATLIGVLLAIYLYFSA